MNPKRRPAQRAASSPCYVSVIGGGDAPPDEREQAQRVGRLLAEGGAVVVCGGLGGAMAAACEGAHEAGGVTVGILPGTDRNAANPHVDIAIPTGLGDARNVLVVRAADAIVAVSGEYGTLSEIALGLATGVPVIGLGTWNLTRRGVSDEAVLRADDAEEAVRMALEAARPSD